MGLIRTIQSTGISLLRSIGRCLTSFFNSLSELSQQGLALLDVALVFGRKHQECARLLDEKIVVAVLPRQEVRRDDQWPVLADCLRVSVHSFMFMAGSVVY
jgi:hypothetical protein